MATVDVLVPTYNRSAMLRRCLESIQAQTYTDIRIIVGDDGVDSDTRTVAQDFCSRDGRFNYVHNSANLGTCTSCMMTTGWNPLSTSEW
jgi:glycosyltransferase involved in cell wall biosynthesis